jgi:two-component system response regulator BaeR
MLTARVDEVDRLLGLEIGADDYVCKPFSPREVVARVRAILRRLEPQVDAQGDVLRLGPFTVDRTRHTVTVDGRAVSLTRIEFELFAALVEQPQRIWSRAHLLERARGTQFEGYERNIDGHVKNLRRKLREHAPGLDVIRSVYGVGYGLETDAFA